MLSDDFFSVKYKYDALTVTLKQQGKQILLKFPVLKQLKLARAHESDFLYVKIDLSPNPSPNFTALTTSSNRLGLNYVARHYDLPSLMAGKLHAVLTRRYAKGSDGHSSIKGRDYFDLLWYCKKGVRPSLARLSDLLSEKITFKELVKAVKEKDVLALKVVEEGGFALGRKIAFLVNLLNPEIVVIGGGIEDCGAPLLDAIKAAIKEWAVEEAASHVKIIPSAFGENAVALGVVGIVAREVFAQA